MPLQNCKISQMARWKIVYINEKSFFFLLQRLRDIKKLGERRFSFNWI